MSTLPPDPYKALGVSPDAQLPEIRSAHRKLVLKCHPDKVQDPTLKAQKQDEFQQVQQAYELLSDEKQRQKYDDQVRLQELREQVRAKANSSSSRSTPTTYKYEIRTNDRTYKTSSPSAKVYSYSRSYEDADLRGADIFEGVNRTVRREASYQGKPSRREERERDRDREIREREKERERERERRKKSEETLRRAEKEAKELRRAEKKQKEKEKEKDKERKRDSEEKKRHAKPYIETYDDEEPAPKSEKKKSSKKHDRDRSTHREEVPPATESVPPPPMPSIPTEQSYEDKQSEALKYINASRQQKKNPYARHMQQPPAAPTPPPVGSPFAAPATPDDDVRRSAAKPRRGSSGEKAYKKKPSKEVLDDPIEVDVSPSGRPHVQKSATSTGNLSGSPPRRTSTMPDAYAGRPIPNLPRAHTYSGYPDVDSRGRNRSKMHAQIIESESEDEYERERRRKERKHRSKKHRSPEPRGEHVMQYRVNEGRTTLQNSFSRSAEPDAYGGYYSHHGERPSLSRDASYSAHSPGYAQYDKYKTSKSWNLDDVQYSTYPTYREEYAYPAAA